MLKGFGKARDGRAEARENIDLQERLQKREAEDARATRRRLESGGAGTRANLSKIQAMAAIDRIAGRAPENVLGSLRSMANLPPKHWSKRTAAQHNASYERLTKSAGGEPLDRLHPSSRLERRGGGVGSRHPAPSNFNFDGGDPGMSGRSNFGEWDRFAPPQRGESGSGYVVPDAAGSLQSDDPRARDHWASGRVEAIQAAFLLEATRLLIEAVRTQRANFPKGRDDV